MKNNILKSLFNKNKKNDSEPISDFENKLDHRYNLLKKAEEFAQIGDIIYYLGQRVTVCGYHKEFPSGIQNNCFISPGINVKWFDDSKKIQQAFIGISEFVNCKNYSKQFREMERNNFLTKKGRKNEQTI